MQNLSENLIYKSYLISTVVDIVQKTGTFFGLYTLFNFYCCRWKSEQFGNRVYKPYLISTVVDFDRIGVDTFVYKPYLISTVVDRSRWSPAALVYKPYLISTVVDFAMFAPL